MKTSIPKLHSIRLKGHENVVPLDIVSSHDIDPQRVLVNALNKRLTNVVVLGYRADGDEFFATSYADGANLLWLLKRGEHRLMQIIDEPDNA